MKKSHAIKWIKALRSGEYKQTKYKLRVGEGFCCLGVLDEIFPEKCLSGDSGWYLNNYKQIGLLSKVGGLGNTVPSLASLNDTGYTFDEIADVIQIEYVEGI